jgi:hypothetical protein
MQKFYITSKVPGERWNPKLVDQEYHIYCFNLLHSQTSCLEVQLSPRQFWFNAHLLALISSVKGLDILSALIC